MNTWTITDARRLGALFLLAGVAALAGCATTGETPKAAQAEQPAGPASVELARRDFYADWYDSTAVVLPPPPAATRR